MWLIDPVEGYNDTFTIRNLASGNYLDLTDGYQSDGTSIYCRAPTGGNNQKWIIKRDVHQEPQKELLWKIQNEASKTFADLYGGGPHLTPITSEQIRTVLQASPYIQKNFPSFNADGLRVSSSFSYLVLSSERLRAIWGDTDLGSTKSRPEIFDIDDFATIFKAEVAKWGNKTFKADGFGILCGMMFGSKTDNNGKEISTAYNWNLEVKDLSKVVFYRPLDGTISYDADGYKAYFGLY
ncbi:carbohydrate-binding module family 13 protein [Pleurotus ostreatus PC15]|uniref:Carbohydrate-binding module family 13 protein n=1 Tax=Pleurotus ostreatus (strain PC15) TaxID=1137138 RepID=A0A067NPS8_PLEO1|nr:carbohydrate-binding module family 13 protein [Pleurotus ostreatus PC15]